MGGFMFDNFNKLEIKKQKQILDGAMEEFSKYGYKKTSVEDIAKSAGISKSMVFYYFNTKLDLYNYLIIYSLNYIIEKYDNLYSELKKLDYLERYSEIAKSKLITLAEEKPLFNFSGSLYLDTDNIEMKEEALELFNKVNNIFDSYQEIMNYEVKNSKLRTDIKKENALQYINWVMDGFSNYMINKYKDVPLGSADYDLEWKKFDKIIEDLEKLFYKKGK